MGVAAVVQKIPLGGIFCNDRTIDLNRMWMIQNHKKWSVFVQKVWILSCSNLNPLRGCLDAHLEAVSIIRDFPSYSAFT